MKNKFVIMGLFWTLIIVGVSGCTKKTDNYQGYIEQRLAYISASYPGVLKQLLVKRGDCVTANQQLFVLEPQPEQASYLQAQADLNSSIADQKEATIRLAHQKLLLSRRIFLVQKKALDQESLDISRVDYDYAVAKLGAAAAKVNAARAALQRAEWIRGQKTVTALKTGIIFDTYFLPSETVPVDRPVLSIIFPDQIRAIFFVREEQLPLVKLGAKIEVQCDGYPNKAQARISFISPQAELTPPTLYTLKERAKFVYRIEAEPLNPKLPCFHPGQPVTIALQGNHSK